MALYSSNKPTTASDPGNKTRKLLNRKYSLGEIFNVALTIICLALTPAIPLAARWLDPNIHIAIFVGLIILSVLTSITLRFSPQIYDHLTKEIDPEPDQDRIDRRRIVSQIVRELQHVDLLKIDSEDHAESAAAFERLKSIRVEILNCLEKALVETLQLSAESIGVNLLLCGTYSDDRPAYSTEDDWKQNMTVVGRSASSRSRPTPKTYSEEQIYSLKAIAKEGPIYHHDLSKSSKSPAKEIYNLRGYRSLAIMPVTYSHRAYGTISIDHMCENVFLFKETLVECEMYPYISLLMATLKKDAPNVECNFTTDEYPAPQRRADR